MTGYFIITRSGKMVHCDDIVEVYLTDDEAENMRDLPKGERWAAAQKIRENQP